MNDLQILGTSSTRLDLVTTIDLSYVRIKYETKLANIAAVIGLMLPLSNKSERRSKKKFCTYIFYWMSD